MKHQLSLALLGAVAAITPFNLCMAETVVFADNGTLKMLYDNRMYPQAVEHGGSV